MWWRLQPYVVGAQVRGSHHQGLWPWTYNECERAIERTSGQLISACTHHEEESGLVRVRVSWP